MSPEARTTKTTKQRRSATGFGALSPSGPIDSAGLDKAFDALRAYDWDQGGEPLLLIEEAVVTSHGNVQRRKDLETRMLAVLKSDAKPAAKQFVCRMLNLIGSADCIPGLAALLTEKDLSHMARFALERIPHPAADAALRAALPKVSGALKVGVINSLGARRDAEATGQIVALVKDSDIQVASAAAAALGKIATPEAARALVEFKARAPKPLQMAAADACLEAADRLVEKGDREAASQIYKQLDSASEPKRVREAAARGLKQVTASPGNRPFR